MSKESREGGGSQLVLSLINHRVDGLHIPQRMTDGYINATALCQASGKQLGHYLSNKNTKLFLEELSADIGIPISELVIITKGGSSSTQGTWMHPDIAVKYFSERDPAALPFIDQIVIETQEQRRLEKKQ